MTIFGWDASHFDAVPDGAKVVAEGFTFMTHKAGGDKNDAELAAWWKEMKPYRDKILLGAYWVLYPGIGVTRANAFLSRLDDQCPGWRDGPFILQADCEEWNQDPGTVPSKTDIRTFCDRLKGVMPKLTPIVYAPKWVYGNKLDGLGYPLWASSYVTGAGSAAHLYPGDSSSRWDAYSGQTPAILQFTSSATIAGQTTCDANAYRGTAAQLKALLAPGWTVPEPPVKETDMNLTDKVGSAVHPDRTVQDFFSDWWKERDVLWGDKDGTKAAALPAGSPLATILGLPARLAALEATVAGIGTAGVTQEQLNAAVYAALKQLAADAA